MELTVWREVHLALGRQEGVALALALELGGERLGGDLLAGDVALARHVRLRSLLLLLRDLVALFHFVKSWLIIKGHHLPIECILRRLRYPLQSSATFKVYDSKTLDK